MARVLASAGMAAVRAAAWQGMSASHQAWRQNGSRVKLSLSRFVGQMGRHDEPSAGRDQERQSEKLGDANAAPSLTGARISYEDMCKVAAGWEEYAQTGSLPDSAVLVLDVREEGEYNAGFIPGAINLPISELTRMDPESAAEYVAEALDVDAARLDLLENREQDIVVYCKLGVRSGLAQLLLGQWGYPRVHNYKGSYEEWSRLSK
ncbi:uncharacterized protein MONBRDRAFT_9436 [Monosiga brevicollis MX1]|uniref:Rhodanese domain-containing protein n=1 Tax=Monosiga brevicollis TaxID=81824 RepID=A9V350_MONBE|nr:uncharacterized protein MONBRDRAFT_9436 [Monosiga brevicollis MX1]EDQ88127.1 predicted protein [Monosiga brevicollis MX1]|eukprot:XP_001747203.1 hypothetical protein [Monosiga brevicollis MX1]